MFLQLANIFHDVSQAVEKYDVIMSNWLSQYTRCGLLLLSLGLFGCTPLPEISQTQLEQIQQRGTLRVGTLFGSTTYTESENGPAGLEFDLAKRFASYLNVELEMVPVHHIQELIRQLQHNEVDLVASGLTITQDRREWIKFASVYYQVSQKLVFKKGTPWPRDIDQLDGSLMVVANSSHAEQLKQLRTQHPHLNWSESDTDSSESLLLKVLAGEITYTVVDSTLLDSMRRYYPELFIAFSLSQADNIAWGFPESDDDSLFALAIEYFSLLREDNTLAQIEDKYFGHIDEFDYVDTRTFIRASKRKLPKYKPLFMKYGTTIDWKLLAAISYQESHWDPNATSFTGVRGLMMLTQATANGMDIDDRLDPEQSILGGARYFERTLRRLPEKVPENERIWFALAAYNVGFGHLTDAMDLTELRGGNRFSWIDVQETLPLLRKQQWYKKTKFGYARGEEPVRYVINIRRYYETLLWLEMKAERKQQLNQQQARFSNISEIMQDIDELKDKENKAAQKEAEEKETPVLEHQKAG